MDHGRTSTDLARAATLPAAAVLAELDTDAGGLTGAQAAERLRETGPNALRSHGARPLTVLVRQLRNPLLLLVICQIMLLVPIAMMESLAARLL